MRHAVIKYGLMNVKKILKYTGSPQSTYDHSRYETIRNRQKYMHFRMLWRAGTLYACQKENEYEMKNALIKLQVANYKISRNFKKEY